MSLEERVDLYPEEEGVVQQMETNTKTLELFI